jgi:hypothetical protein
MDTESTDDQVLQVRIWDLAAIPDNGGEGQLRAEVDLQALFVRRRRRSPTPSRPYTFLHRWNFCTETPIRRITPATGVPVSVRFGAIQSAPQRSWSCRMPRPSAHGLLILQGWLRSRKNLIQTRGRNGGRQISLGNRMGMGRLHHLQPKQICEV